MRKDSRSVLNDLVKLLKPHSPYVRTWNGEVQKIGYGEFWNNANSFWMQTNLNSTAPLPFLVKISIPSDQIRIHMFTYADASCAIEFWFNRKINPPLFANPYSDFIESCIESFPTTTNPDWLSQTLAHILPE